MYMVKTDILGFIKLDEGSLLYFRTIIGGEDCSGIYEETNPDEAFNLLSKILNACYNEVFPHMDRLHLT